MSNLQQAPMLKTQGQKKKLSKGYWAYDPAFMQFLLCNCTLNQLKLMLYLCGNEPGWLCSTKNVLERTGIPSKQKLSSIKQELAKKGWITQSEGEHITVNYDIIYAQIEGNQNDDPATAQSLINAVQGNQNDDPKKRGNQNDDPKGNQNGDPMGNRNDYPKGNQNDYHNNISCANNINNNTTNTTIADDKQEPKELGYEEALAQARTLYIQSAEASKIASEKKFTRPFPQDASLILLNGEYINLTAEWQTTVNN